MTPRISVVIPAFNSARTVGDTVRAVMQQSLPHGSFECVVVDDGSRDATAEVAHQAGAKVLRQPQNGGIAAARNAGIQWARAPWIAFTDSDCVPTRRWLSLLLAEAEKAGPDVMGIAGKTLGLESNTSPARFIDLSGALDAETYLQHKVMPWAPGANIAYRRDQLLEIGGFDSSFRSYENADLTLRLQDRFGGRIVYVPHAVVFHRHRATWRALWKQQHSYGAGYSHFLKKHSHRWPWSVTNELRAWKNISAFALRACVSRGDHRLLHTGLFVKHLAQRFGFIAFRVRGRYP